MEELVRTSLVVVAMEEEEVGKISRAAMELVED
jgi:hypothetical protein